MVGSGSQIGLYLLQGTLDTKGKKERSDPPLQGNRGQPREAAGKGRFLSVPGRPANPVSEGCSFVVVQAEAERKLLLISVWLHATRKQQQE